MQEDSAKIYFVNKLTNSSTLILYNLTYFSEQMFAQNVFLWYNRVEKAKNDERISLRMKQLPPIERKIYDYINKTVSEKGYSPSIRDIKNELSIKSTSTVHLHLSRLEQLGLINKELGKSRTIRTDAEPGALKNKIPILGQIKDGAPLNANENFDGYIDFAISNAHKREDTFAVRAKDVFFINLEDVSKEDVIIAERSESFATEDTVIFLRDLNLYIDKYGSITKNANILGKIIALIRFF